MPLSSVQTFVRDQIDGLDVGVGALSAHIAPPPVGDVSAPQAYVWGARGGERRDAAAGGHPAATGAANAGVKRVTYHVDIWLKVALPIDDAAGDSDFPGVIDAVCDKLRTIPIVQSITDPRTGLSSRILSIGEEIDFDYAPVRALQDQRYVLYEATLTALVIELFNA